MCKGDIQGFAWAGNTCDKGRDRVLNCAGVVHEITSIAFRVHGLFAGVLCTPAAHDVPHHLCRRIRLQPQGIGMRPRHPVPCMSREASSSHSYLILQSREKGFPLGFTATQQRIKTRVTSGGSSVFSPEEFACALDTLYPACAETYHIHSFKTCLATCGISRLKLPSSEC